MHNSLSGKFVLRIPKNLHMTLKKRVEQEGVSLNALCTDALQSFGDAGRPGFLPGNKPSSEKWILEAFGGSLLGLILFGSYARGEQREDSDVDLMIVLSDSTPLDRSLYALWDEKNPSGPGDRLSPHFVHIPERTDDAGSIWLEAAIDGIMLYDNEHAVGRFLSGLRRAIMTGMFRRGQAYGQPYWSNTAHEAARDHMKRAGNRLRALETLMEAQSWADVVREAQEIVEITLKALLRACRIEAPRIHDVSPILLENRERLPAKINDRLEELVAISRSLRRDRELAFYGSEDLTPSEFYKEKDATDALAQARTVHEAVSVALEKV